MKRASSCACAAVALACGALLLTPGGAAAQPGAGAHLMLWLDGDQVDTYFLTDIQRFTFSGDPGDTLFLEADGGGPYLLESVRLITFDPDEWVGVDEPWLPVEAAGTLHLTQNRPNPFCPETRMAFTMPAEGRVELRVYSVDGRLVTTLVDGRMTAGPHTVTWDGRDESGREVASGVYFCGLAALGIEENMKMLLVR